MKTWMVMEKGDWIGRHMSTKKIEASSAKEAAEKHAAYVDSSSMSFRNHRILSVRECCEESQWEDWAVSAEMTTIYSAKKA